MAREAPRSDVQWLVYVASLPMDDPAARMRVLRTLEAMGCALLREGVYLLPDTPVNRQGLQRLSEHMNRINGSAHLLHVTSADAEQGRAFKSLFDRAAKYELLIKTIEGLRAGFGISEPSAIARVLNKQRREFEAISALDFFDSPLKERTARALRETEAEVRKRMFPDAPKSGGRLTQTGRFYFKRVRQPRSGSASKVRPFPTAETK